jgi:hypothetical protein
MKPYGNISKLVKMQFVDHLQKHNWTAILTGYLVKALANLPGVTPRHPISDAEQRGCQGNNQTGPYCSTSMFGFHRQFYIFFCSLIGWFKAINSIRIIGASYNYIPYQLSACVKVVNMTPGVQRRPDFALVCVTVQPIEPITTHMQATIPMDFEK